MERRPGWVTYTGKSVNLTDCQLAWDHPQDQSTPRYTKVHWQVKGDGGISLTDVSQRLILVSTPRVPPWSRTSFH